MIRSLLYFLFFMLISGASLGQVSSVYFRNNTWNNFNIDVEQIGTMTLNSGSDYNLVKNSFYRWETDTEIANVDRNAVPDGNTVIFKVRMMLPADTIKFMFKLVGAQSGPCTMEYSVEGNGFVDPWYSNGDDHAVITGINGKPVVVKYKPINGDGSSDRDVLFVIHDDPIYEIDAADFSNPNVLNVMAYNIQMLPFGVSGMPQADDRGDFFPAELSPYQDAVVFCELFDQIPREGNLEPAMAAAGFPYKTSILNDGIFPSNGGVMIFSRWPIEESDELDFALCGQAAQDCLANKGIKYASINKLGRKYHIFGTHMDAGSQADDVAAKRSQMGEMKHFIPAQNIPFSEGVVFGGDFNVGPLSSDNLYQNFLDTLNPLRPHHIGFQSSSTSDSITGKIIDHFWADSRYLIPIESTNDIITPRSIDDVLWDLSEFSDHRACLGRFVYPDIQAVKNDTILCEGVSHTMTVSSDYPSTYQWYKDGNAINGATNASYSITNSSSADAGNYVCEISYQVVRGDTNDAVNALHFYPNGPETFTANIPYDMGTVQVDDVLCLVGIDELSASVKLAPNPVTDQLNITFLNGVGSGSLKVVDQLGRVIYSEDLVPNELSTEAWSKGLYVLQFQIGEQVFSKKIVKQ